MSMNADPRRSNCVNRPLTPHNPPLRSSLVVVAFVLFCTMLGHAQSGPEPGHAIGTVTTRGKLILLTLNDGALGRANMFNLAHHTLRFTPDGAGYRVENVPFAWDPDFGAAL